MTAHFRRVRFIIFVGAMVFVIAPSATRAAGPASAPAAAPSALYDRIVSQYFAGKWDELTADLIARSRDVATLSPAQKSDVDYIRRTIAECRPPWWKTVKAGAAVKFRPAVWGQTLTAAFDPEAKQNIHIDYLGGVPSVIVRWNAKDMDDPAVVGELQFTKGETVDVDLWSTLGSAGSWADIPVGVLKSLTDEGRLQLSTYLNFRGSLASAYYTTPRARRLALWNAISGWSHEYDKQPNRIERRTLGIFFAEEVLAHPEVYTSVPRPKEPPAAGAESHMIWELQEYIRHNDLSLSEEKSFRTAVKAFAVVNESRVRTSSKVMLPSGQAFSLDPAADKALEAQRDAWIKMQYAGGGKSEIRSPKSETSPKPQ